MESDSLDESQKQGRKQLKRLYLKFLSRLFIFRGILLVGILPRNFLLRGIFVRRDFAGRDFPEEGFWRVFSLWMDLNNQLLQLMMEKYVYLFQTFNFLDFFGEEVYKHVIIL